MADAKIATVKWQGGLVFEGAANSGIPARMDGQAKAGVSPMEMIVLGLAGCTGADVIDILRKKRQEVTALEIRVTGERAEEHPRKYTAMEVAYVVTGRHIDPAAVARAIELSETKYCSVAASLRGTVTITSTYDIREVEPAAVA
jgi:putative redox protein